jgi:hypothetical protein
LNDLYLNNKGRGIILEGVTLPEQFMALETFARYAWDPTRPHDDREWMRYLARRYGYATAAMAGPLLEAMKAAGMVIPLQMRLTHSQTGAFMPQMGMPLVQMLEMPSISTYIFENVQTVGTDGYLTPNMGLCWPNPDWGTAVMPLRWYGLTTRDREQWMRQQAELGYSPKPIMGREASLVLLDSLDNLGYTIEGRVKHVPPAKRSSTELARILKFLSMQAALAHHFAAKNRAALAWEKYRVWDAAGHRSECEHNLAASVEAWDKFAAIADRLHPGGAWYTAVAINYPPPWSQMDLWNGYVSGKTTFRERGRMWERELELVREELASVPHDRITLPLFDDLRAPKADGRLVALVNLEEPDKRISLLSDSGLKTEVTRHLNLVISGQASLLADSRASDREWNEFMAVSPQQVPLQANGEYQVVITYRVIDGGDGAYRAPFGMALRTASGGVENDVGDSRMWSGPEGKVRQRVLFARLRDFPDYYLFLCIRGRAAIAVDDIRIEKLP